MVSIIMPAYNAEKHITECIESILVQSYDNWELIIVNDGSTDGTAGICSRYAESDKRIRILHQKNKGVSAARNTGMKIASGEYIAFADADDILPPKSLEVRIKLIRDADLIIGGYELFDENGIIEKMPSTRKKQWRRHETTKNIIASGALGYQGYLWNKLFRKTILDKNDIYFAEDISVNEDRLFCVKYAMCSKKTYLSNSLVYRYRISHTNTTSSVYKMTEKDLKRFSSEFLAFDRTMNAVRDDFPDCAYWGAVEAQYRAVRLKERLDKNETILVGEVNRHIRNYGKVVLKAPAGIIPVEKKITIFLHMILLR